jgi:orotate phosphoribosyltransferase-like protein
VQTDSWELETVRWVVERARDELSELQESHASWASLAKAQHRYESALRLMQRIERSMKENAQPEEGVQLAPADSCKRDNP